VVTQRLHEHALTEPDDEDPDAEDQAHEDRVNDRLADHDVDLVEAVLQDRDAHGDRHREQREVRDEGDDVGVRLDDAHRELDGEDEGRRRHEPLHLLPLITP
jgi:hypothetical protein